MPVKKTVSLSKNSLVALFKVLGEILEEDSELAEHLRSELSKRLTSPAEEPAELTGFFSSTITNEEIKSRLEQLPVSELIALVNKHALDPARNIRKNVDKDKIIAFILERRTSLINRYKGF